MTGAELAELVETLRRIETDTASVEAKRARHELPKRLWETLSAFANSPGGGVLILGLEESSGFAASGVSDVKKVQADLGSLMGAMDPPLRAVIDAHRLEGVDLVVAEVPELPAERKPCYYPGAGLTNGAFVRVADGDRKLSQYEVGLLLAARSQPREDEQPEPRAHERDLDAELVEAILARLRDRPGSVFRDLDDRTALETLRVLVPGEDGGLVPSIGGLLALGRYPQQFFPALALTLVVYPTPRVGEPGPGGERFLDNAELEGPIPRLVPRALDVLRRNMRERSIVTGVGRQTLWEYPEVALREAIVNALAHRDLSAMARGTPVQVQMFPDRLTITNPGGLFGPVTLDRLGEQGLAAARNQTLMKLLEDVPAPGEGGAVSENRGSGIGAMLAALRHAGMSPPDFADRIATFEVTFPNHTLLDEDTLRWLRTIDRELTDSQRMALALLRRGEELDNASYRQLTGLLDSRVATRELADLVEAKLVRQEGTRRWASYRLAASGHQDERSGDGRQRRDRRQDVLELLQAGPLARREIAESLAIEDAVATYWLRVLREEGRVASTARALRDPRTRYVLVDKR